MNLEFKPINCLQRFARLGNLSQFGQDPLSPLNIIRNQTLPVVGKHGGSAMD